jgi:hypothetical protein
MKTIHAIGAAAIGLAATAVGCGATVAPPVERLASTDAAIRSARELGAASDPQAALHLKLADEQIARARQLMNDGDNRQADLLLQRAKSDAELSVMITKERSAEADATKAKQILDDDRAKGAPAQTPPTQGGVPQ